LLGFFARCAAALGIGAKALGLSILQSLLATADEVIE